MPSDKPVESSLRNEIGGRISLLRSLPRNGVDGFSRRLTTDPNTAGNNNGNRIVVIEGDHINSHRGRRRGARSSNNNTTATATATATANGPQDDAFDNFDVFTGEDDHNNENVHRGGGGDDHNRDGDQSSSNMVYRPWGDELLVAMGRDPCAYPACEPPRPPEMIRDLSSRSKSGSTALIVQ